MQATSMTASKEYPIDESVANSTAMWPAVTVGDIRRAHQVRQDVLVALLKAQCQTDNKPHEMAHVDAPTWCRWCGTFDVYCRDGESCPRQDRTGTPRWDMGEFPTVKAEVPA